MIVAGLPAMLGTYWRCPDLGLSADMHPTRVGHYADEWLHPDCML